MDMIKEIRNLDLGRFSGKIKKSKIILNSDGTFDYKGDLTFGLMNLKSLTEISIRFRKVSGDFFCSSNELTSLEGSPLEIGGHFNCFDNELINLEGAPLKVGGYFNCISNLLISLQYAPLKVVGNFQCWNNNLLSKGCSSVLVNGSYDFNPNPLKITDEVIETVKQMTYDQQMSELKFFDENDLNASKMFQEVLDSLGVEYGTHRKEMRNIVKDLNLGHLGI
jgi:hypothetical protein